MLNRFIVLFIAIIAGLNIQAHCQQNPYGGGSGDGHAMAMAVLQPVSPGSERIAIYPNPFSASKNQELALVLPANSGSPHITATFAEVRDMQGRLVLICTPAAETQSSNSLSYELRFTCVKHLQPGVYTFRYAAANYLTKLLIL